MLEHTRTVSELTSYISNLFSTDHLLKDVDVQGEVSNMTRAKSGHWYFTLKDSEASLKCVMWRSDTQRQPIVPQAGDAIQVRGSLGIYAPRGEYQLYAKAIRPVGVGDLHQQFERLKAKLMMEGLFDADLKREPPLLPLKIGVATSPTAAAFQDVLNVLQRRFPLVEVILSPSQVQGVDAPPQIIDALDKLNMYTDVDVILLVRGGGSIEDLWAFNDEGVARAVRASHIPVITGVGHETDFTIVDFLSDIRAPTPSAAAEIAVPSIAEIQQNLDDRQALLEATMDDIIAAQREALTHIDRDLAHFSPINAIRNHRQRIDDFTQRLDRAQTILFKQLRERLDARSRALHAASPQAILERGYAIVTRADGKRIVSELDAKPGDAITLQLRDGQLNARIEEEDTDGKYQHKLL
jgi:exodeoxyribonuclease VII large subunit